MRARPHFQVDIGQRQSQIDEEPLVHVGIVMLARMHELRRQYGVMRGKRAQDRRHLHEVGTRTDHAKHRARGQEPLVRYHGFTCFFVAGGLIASARLRLDRVQKALQQRNDRVRAALEARQPLLDRIGLHLRQQARRLVGGLGIEVQMRRD